MSTANVIIPPQIDLNALKTRQRGAWSAGDYSIVGTTLQIVGEELCEAMDLRSGESVLDVAAGNGNVSLAAARRWCNVTATDYVPSCLHVPKNGLSRNDSTSHFRKLTQRHCPLPTAVSMRSLLRSA